jgi:hypothetical protein
MQSLHDTAAAYWEKAASGKSNVADGHFMFHQQGQSFANRTIGALIVAILLIVCAISQVDALSVELAKKCRDMAIKSHPPPIPPGNKAYAQAERDFFRECVSRNGQMPNADSQNQSNPAQR